MSQTEKSNTNSFQNEMDFSKNVLENIFNGKSNVTEGAAKSSIENEDVENYIRESREVANILGDSVFEINQSKKKVKALEESLLILHKNRKIPKKTVQTVLKIQERMEKYEKYLLQFIKKYS